MSSLGKLFGAFGNLQNDLMDGAVMTAGAVAGVVGVNKVLELAGGEGKLVGFLPEGKVRQAAIPALKVVLGAIGPGLAMGFLPRNPWVKKGLDGAGVGLAVSGWLGLFRTLAPPELVSKTLPSVTFGILGGTPSYLGGAQVAVEYLNGGDFRGAQLAVEDVGKFGGLGNQTNRYASIMGA